MPIPFDTDGMTWLNPGAVQLDAGELRRADAALLAGANGVAFGGIARHSDTSLAVTVNGSDVVTVQAGSAVIPGDAVSGTGVYRVGIAAAQSGNLTARNATNSRIDLVVIRAMDTDVVPAHASYRGRIEIIAGTPSATPAVPVRPTMSVELARITVPATGGGAASVDSTWRTYACTAGGVLLVPTSQRLPAAGVPYRQRAMAIDTGVEYEYRSGWFPVRLATTANIVTDANGISGYVNFLTPFSLPPVVVFSVVGGSAIGVLYDVGAGAVRFKLTSPTGAAYVGNAQVSYLATAIG